MFRFTRKIKTRLQMCNHICLFCKWKHQCRMERNHEQLSLFDNQEVFNTFKNFIRNRFKKFD